MLTQMPASPAAVSTHDAQKEFVDFADSYSAVKAESPDDIVEMGYRFDTWQLWLKCNGAEEGHARCQNPGLHVGIDAPNPFPFVVNLGPFTMLREKTVEAAYSALSRVGIMIQMEAGHIHYLDQPHHPFCTLCIPADSEH